MKKPTRRKFMQQTSAASLSVWTAASAQRIFGANDRVRIGFIGVGNRGDQVLDAFLVHPDAQIISIADVYQPYLPFAARKAGGSPTLVKDYRKILEQKDVDAVVVATPDHWHALQMIHSCEAGKDVYVEKPLSLTIGEGRRMVEAARRTQRVVQVGIQRRSSKFVKEAADFIRSGGIGHVTVAKCYHILNETPFGIGNPPDSAPPEGLDWDLWLGPAPKVPYNENRCLYKFRWFYDYSGGQLTNFGTHYLDNIQWALGETAPTSITALGGKFALKDNREIPIPSKCSGNIRAARWLYSPNTTATPPLATPQRVRSSSEARKARSISVFAVTRSFQKWCATFRFHLAARWIAIAWAPARN